MCLTVKNSKKDVTLIEKIMNLEKAITEILVSLEYDTPKEESFVSDLLVKHKIERARPLKKLTRKICSRIESNAIIFEEFFGDILNYIQPFALMLEKIYIFLNDYSVTIKSRASQFRFNFEKLQKNITFDISNFPMDFVRDFGYKEVSSFLKEYEINLDAKGDYDGNKQDKLAIDFLTLYDGDFYNQFLTPVSYFWSIKDNVDSSLLDQFIELEKQINKIFGSIRVLLDLLLERFQLSPKQIEMVFFGRLQEDLAEVDIIKHRILLKKGFDLDEWLIKEKSNNDVLPGLAYRLNCLALALQFWENKYKRDVLDKGNWAFERKVRLECLTNPGTYVDLIEKQLQKYEKALDDILVFKGYKKKKILIENLLKFVRLPYWKHRWHIYELWTLILCLSIAKNSYKVSLNLEDHVDYLELVIPKAAAKKPVANIHSNQVEMECWFQRKTINPITGKGIEPDLRFMNKEMYPNDIFVIENKDRRNCAGTHLKRVREKYFTGTNAKNIWIVNYENYRGKKYSTKLSKETIDNRNIWVASNFKPKQIPIEFCQNFDSMLQGYFDSKSGKAIFRYDLIVDKSSSMDSKPILSTVESIYDLFGYNPDAMYLFDAILTKLDFNDLDRIREFISNELECTNGTELVRCFEEYLDSKNEFPEMIYIITDGDGLDDCYEKHHLEMLNQGSSLVFVKI